MGVPARIPPGVLLAAWLLRLFVLPFALLTGLLVPAVPLLLLVVAASVEAPTRYGHFAILLTAALGLVAVALLLGRLWLAAALWEACHAGDADGGGRAVGLRRLWRRDAIETAALASAVLAIPLVPGSLVGSRLLEQPWLLGEACVWALAPMLALRRRSGRAEPEAS